MIKDETVNSNESNELYDKTSTCWKNVFISGILFVIEKTPLLTIIKNPSIIPLSINKPKPVFLGDFTPYSLIYAEIIYKRKNHKILRLLYPIYVIESKNGFN